MLSPLDIELLLLLLVWKPNTDSQSSVACTGGRTSGKRDSPLDIPEENDHSGGIELLIKSTLCVGGCRGGDTLVAALNGLSLSLIDSPDEQLFVKKEALSLNNSGCCVPFVRLG